MTKKPKKPDDTELDDIARGIVIIRDKCCIWCGSIKILNASHIKPKGRNKSMRWDLDNVILLCWHCHFSKAHKDPLAFADFIRSKFGQTKYDELTLRANTPNPSIDRFDIKRRLLEAKEKGDYYAQVCIRPLIDDDGFNPSISELGS